VLKEDFKKRLPLQEELFTFDAEIEDRFRHLMDDPRE
jgi:hypothetical protein